MCLRKVISGYQIGVDQAAIHAAHFCEIETGGWMPRGWRTHKGSDPDAAVFGLRQYGYSTGYSARTDANVRDADATLRIADNFGSPGELCTLRAIRKHGKRYLDVQGIALGRLAPGAGDALKEDDFFVNREAVLEVAYWIRDHKIGVLNVAGNSEKTAPGLGARAEFFLRQVFSSHGVKAKV